MAIIRKRGSRFLGMAKLAGCPTQSKTFATEEEARAWADARRLDIAVARDQKKACASVDALIKIPLLHSFCGVYFLFEEDRVVYVGQSTNVHVRVRRHFGRRFKSCTSYAWMPVAPENLTAVENDFIRAIKPKHNIVGNTIRRQRANRKEVWSGKTLNAALRRIEVEEGQRDIRDRSSPIKNQYAFVDAVISGRMLHAMLDGRGGGL